jgi:hypothetical protein
MEQRKPGCICQLDDNTGIPVVEHYEECPVHRSEAPDPKKDARRIFDSIIYYTNNKAIAKTCSIVCVDEVLTILRENENSFYNRALGSFYEQVRVELTNLQ